MNTEQLKVMEQLTAIGSTIEGLRANIHRIAHQDQAITGKLAQIWDVTQELQRQLVNPEVIKGQREDAVAQVQRIVDMFQACDGNPDDRELVGLGYACELGRDKIGLYMVMDRKAMLSTETSQEAA
ncbi:MAG: hypothetical protein AB7U29_15550 [Desulfobulbus sp.]